MTAAAPGTKKNLQVSLEERGVAEITINGAKVAEITSDGNVVPYADFQVKPASTYADAEKDAPIGVIKSFNSVAVYGTTVEAAMDGSLIVYTNGKVFTNPATVNDTSVESLKIGMKMKDGTYYVGISPDTEQPMYAAPSDAPMKLDFNQAAKYAQDLEVGGKQGFRVPSLAELNVMRYALLQNEEAKATLDLANDTGFLSLKSWYWSSSPYSNEVEVPAARCQRLRDGYTSHSRKSVGMSVRPVRS